MATSNSPKRLLIIGLFLLLLAPATTNAQAPESQKSEPQKSEPQISEPQISEPQKPEPTIEALAEQVTAIETKTSRWERFLAHLPKISGYIQAGYSWSESSSDFFVKRACLYLSGDITPKFDYLLQVDFRYPKILDACLQYKPFPQLNLKLGEYKVPFSIESTDFSPLRLEFVDCAQVVRQLIGYDDLCGQASTGRDMGFSIWGGFIKRDGYQLINYDLGVFNGEGINTRDKNKSKDIVGRLTIKPLAGLQLSGSYYWGEYSAAYLKRIRYGAGVCYDRGPVVLRGEYIYGITGMPTEGAPATNLRSAGWYGVAAWRVTRSLMPAIRYDTFVRNCRFKPESRQTNYTLGLVWQPKKFLRCQLDYTYEVLPETTHSNRNGVNVLVSGIF